MGNQLVPSDAGACGQEGRLGFTWEEIGLAASV
jgi:hypothetical protein